MEWSTGTTATIAAQVRHHRLKHGMSAQQVSDAMDAFGVPMARPVLSNLENGRREAVSVPELLALSAVLRVPPLLLLLPMGQADQVEILPGVTVQPGEAAEWMRTGILDAAGMKPAQPADAELLRRFESHETLVRMYQTSRAQDGPLPSNATTALGYAVRDIRALLRSGGHEPPALSGDLQVLDEPTGDAVDPFGSCPRKVSLAGLLDKPSPEAAV